MLKVLQYAVTTVKSLRTVSNVRNETKHM